MPTKKTAKKVAKKAVKKSAPKKQVMAVEFTPAKELSAKERRMLRRNG